ncbi:MAG: energy transducer TonB [Bryobacteraceae bacterium]|nr:energy transducer TonB [Bryobacteraceae bacterium]
MPPIELIPELPPPAEPALPRIVPLEQLQQRPGRLWYSTQALSSLLHLLFLAFFLRHGLDATLFSQRSRPGYQFGQAVMLTSPLFELGDRDGIRGKQGEIPLSALVPNRPLIAPDLRRLNLRPLDPAETERSSAGPKQHASQQSPSNLPLPAFGGGGALPSGGLLNESGSGPSIPFDLVPPSNSRERRPGDRPHDRLVVGDSSRLGGGTGEGLRLPESPARIGSSIEVLVQAHAARILEEYLRLFLTRFRRACFEAFPEKLALGASGETVLALSFEKGGRIRAVEVVQSSGNPALDRQAREAVALTPAFQPLPAGYPEPRVRALLRLRYGVPR